MEIDKVEDIEEDLESSFVTNNLKRISKTTSRKNAIKFRLNVLNTCLGGGIIKGDFGIVGAYAEVGKTSFITSEVSFMATNLKEGCILWLNNEEPEDRVYKRIWEAVLETDWKEIISPKWIKKAEQAFKDKMNGDLDRIRMYDIRTLPLHKIRQLVEKWKPRLLVIDLADQVWFSEDSGLEHTRITKLYQQLRAISREFCPVIAVSHTDASIKWQDRNSGEINSIKYLDHSKLAGSKIGKAGAADFIIMLSKDETHDNIRYMNLSKNKLNTDSDVNSHVRTDIYYDPKKHHFINRGD